MSLVYFQIPTYTEPETEDEQVLDESIEQHKEEIEHEQEQESQAVPIMGDQGRRKSLYLDAGQTHMVWKPTHRETKKNIRFIDTENRQDLLERWQKLQSRIIATQEVLKDQLAVLSEEDEKESTEVHQPMSKGRIKWQKTIQDVIKDNAKGKKKLNAHFHEVVSMYVESMSTPKPKKPIAPGFQQWKSQFKEDDKERTIPMHEKGGKDQCVKSQTTIASTE